MIRLSLACAFVVASPRLFDHEVNAFSLNTQISTPFYSAESRARNHARSTTDDSCRSYLVSRERALVASRGARSFAKSRLRAISEINDLEDLEDVDPYDGTTGKDGESVREVLYATLGALKKLDRDIVPEAEVAKLIVTPAETKEPIALEKEIKLQKTTEESSEERQTIRTAINIIKFLLESADDAKEDLDYATYPRHPEFPDVDLSHMMKMLEGIPPLEYFFSAKKTIALIRRVVRLNLGFRVTQQAVDEAETAKEKYRAIFSKEKLFFGLVDNPINLVPLPEYTYDHWKEDKYVAYQFLNGVNPVIIQVVNDVKSDLSTELVDYFGEERLQGLQDSKRLLFARYDHVAQLGVNPHMSYPDPPNTDPQPPPGSVNGPQFFQGPVALFELSEDREELNILGVQLYRDLDADTWCGGSTTRKVYTREDSTDDEWLFVKTCLTNADSQTHEWVSHLGKTHLTMEPHIVAIHNTLKKKKHPVYTFVKPLCRDTLLLNWAARRTLASFEADSFGDYMTSVGTGQFMQLIQTYWKGYDFFESSAFPNELASRGFDDNFDLPCYHFREDGLRLWDAYGEFATNFVNEIYSSDKKVKEDEVLHEWAVETVDQDRANIPGFPAFFPDRKTLAYTLQTLGWMSGCLHAAVNFPQYEFYAYQANKPLHLRGNLPNEKQIAGTSEEALFENNLPDMNRLKGTISTANTLTLPSFHNLDELSSNFENIGRKSYARFERRLGVISDEIEKRNSQLEKDGKQTYNYLNPKVVPASIDI